MDAKSETGAAATIDGHAIDLGPAHWAAFYDRNGVSWVAEFRGGRGEVMNASTWYYFHAGRLGYWNSQRGGGRFSTPLTPDMLEAIQRLHEAKEARAASPRKRKLSLAEAAARLARAIETVDAAADGTSAREQAMPLARMASGSAHDHSNVPGVCPMAHASSESETISRRSFGGT